MKESLSSEERDALLEEIRSYLPAFLRPAATEQPDPAGDVRELLRLERQDLDRVVAVHQCLAPAVLRLGEELDGGLQNPFSRKTTATVIGQAVRGPIDWPGTIKQRSRAPGEAALYSIRESGSSTYDTAENRAVAWLLGFLEELVDRASTWTSKEPSAGRAELGWTQKIDRLGEQVSGARQIAWLRPLRAEKPTGSVVQSMRSSRNGFYAELLPAAIESVMRLQRPSSEALTAVLSERYFQPADDGTLFEVAVALRLARAFEELSPRRRRTRLLMGDRRSSFVRYAYDDGSEVSIAYQAWPDGDESMRKRFVRRHRIAKRAMDAIPDIIILRRGASDDAVILELKASADSAYLRRGLQELLAYLADRPELWGVKPAAWLVAPPSSAFEAEEADSQFPIWVLSAEEVAAAATARFVDS